MDLRLRGRVAVITGGSKGLGAASARLLAEEGAKLVLAARDGTALDALAERLRSVSGVDGIVVNAVNSGPSRTERWQTLMANLAKQGGKTVEEVESGLMKEIPMRRLCAPEEIARYIVFLASKAAANMTGSSITADGGWIRSLA